LGKGYAANAAGTLVGDHHALHARQRTAVGRCSCGDDARRDREARRVEIGDLAGQALAVDGFNLLTTVEAALAGGVVIVGRDGCHRDMASMHGSWRRVQQTRAAIDRVAAVLAAAGRCTWLLDRPVSNSGRLAAMLRETAAAGGHDWEVLCEDAVDARLRRSADVVVTADAGILDAAVAWSDVARRVIRAAVPGAWIVDLGG
jgi:hypothetical protein